MITVVQAVYFTSRTGEWHRFAKALGLEQRLPLDPEWSEFEGDGVLAIHRADIGGPAEGTTKLQLLVDQFDDLEARWRDENVVVDRSSLAGVGDLVTARPSGGVDVSAIATSGDVATSGHLSVMPILYLPELEELETILVAAGLTVRIRSTNGVWTDLRAGSGLVGLHTGPPRTELSFEYAASLDELAASITDAGYPADVIDEAYNRTLVVTTPDNWTLRINGAQDDLHGYTRAE